MGDLAAWDTALARGTIVSQDDYVLMSAPAVLSNGALSTYGMGLSISELDGHKRVWHSGQSNGSATMNAVYPSDRVAVIVFENVGDGDTNAIETAVFEQLFPKAAAAASKPAAGEDPAVRRRALHFIDETLRGSIPAGEMSPQFQKIATPEMQRDIAQHLAQLGPPKAVVFMGKGDRPGATRYTYRTQFGSRAITFVLVINKRTHLLDTMGIRPE